MAIAVHLPKVGMTMEEGTLQRWLVPDGAAVRRGQPIFEMETEKVQMEVEADGEGLLRQLVAEGTTLKPGDVVGCLLAPGEELPEALKAAVSVQAASTRPTGLATTQMPASSPAPQAGEAPRATPIARRLAAERGIDLARITGSGPGGRIVEQDVLRAVEAAGAQPSAATAPSAGAITTASLPYSGRRRTIGERMLQSLQSMAQLTLVSEVAADAALEMVHALNREWRREGLPVTLTSLLVRACALALRDHPRLNARLEGDRIELHEQVNLGIAIDLEEGVVVPVVRDAGSLSLKDVASRVRTLSEKARSGGLAPEDVAGGTFTLTSLESSRVDAFTPVINPPQAAILGVGRVREVAAFAQGTVVPRRVTTLSLTFDHRICDGAPAARFLDRVCELLERPYLLM